MSGFDKFLYLDKIYDLIISANNAITLEHLLYRLYRTLHLFLGVRSHKRVADQRVVGSHCGSHDRIDKHPFVKKISRDVESLIVIADKERNNRCGSIADFASEIPELFKSIVGYIPKMLLTLGSDIIMSRAALTAAVEAGVMLAVKM